MGATPEKYLSVITCEQRVKGNLMSLHDLEIVMYQLWHQSKGSIDQHTSEINLAAFEGHCYQCKQIGHKADACHNRGAKKNDGAKAFTGRGGRGGRGNGRKGARFQGTCQNCGKQGHKESNCRQKEENAGLRPSGYRVPNESGNSAVDRRSTGNKSEYLLCALAFQLTTVNFYWIQTSGS
jgi:hypothetical protein